MKTELEKLVEASETLCTMIDALCNNEEHCYVDLILQLERYSWQALCMKNNLKELAKEVLYV